MTNSGDLLKAYNDTTHVQLDMGADPDVLAELGFESFEDTMRLIEQMTPQEQKVAQGAGAITCADCGQVIPCAHAGIGRNGRGFTRGN